jgi:hypothetical protein
MGHTFENECQAVSGVLMGLILLIFSCTFYMGVIISMSK